MLYRVTALLTFLLLPFAVQAQVSANLKQIFAVNPDSLAKAEALGADLTRNDFQRLTRSPFADTTVRFTAVLMSDPLNSGLASANDGAAPGRVHVFVRDTAAVSDPDGLAGYGAQVVDGDYQTSGLRNLAPGAVITITGAIAYFSGVPQISPTSVELVTTDYRSLNLPSRLLDPIPVTIGDLNGGGVPDTTTTNAQSTINFANYDRYAQEYVRVENVTVASVSEGTGSRTGRFNMYFAKSDRTLAFTDVSLRYRNDRIGSDGYTGLGFNVRTEPFVPPAEGSQVNIQGFTIYADFDGERFFNPNMQLVIAPFEDADLEVLPGGPPVVANPSRPTSLVSANADFSITAEATAGEERTLSMVELLAGAPGAAKTSYPMTLVSGTQYTGTIPASALTEGAFVEYLVRATDNAGGSSESQSTTFRVLTMVDKIADIQTTATGGAGMSPIAGVVFDAAEGLLDLNVTLQTNADSTGLYVVQDGTGPWSGLFLAPNPDIRALSPGATIRITGGEVEERFDVTQLKNITFSVVSARGAPYPYVEVTTDAMQDVPTAEAHEGMLLRFNNVEITNVNPDAPSNFGEWSFQTVGTTAAVRADDQSRGIASSFNGTLSVGSRYDYIQGVWSFSFGNWKLLPQVESDLVLAVAALPGELPEGFALGQNYPNPALDRTTIPFSLETAGPVTLDVFDTLGRRVARVLDRARPAGKQEVSFDTNGLSAGLYIYRITAGSDTATAALVVLR